MPEYARAIYSIRASEPTGLKERTCSWSTSLWLVVVRDWASCWGCLVCLQRVPSRRENPLSPSVAGPIPGVGISAPTLSQPAIGAQIRVEQQPVTLSVGNSTSTGVRPLVYAFQVAADAGFSNIVFSREGVTPGDNGGTSLRLSDPLASGRTYYWRSKAWHWRQRERVLGHVELHHLHPCCHRSADGGLAVEQ